MRLVYLTFLASLIACTGEQTSAPDTAADAAVADTPEPLDAEAVSELPPPADTPIDVPKPPVDVQDDPGPPPPPDVQDTIDDVESDICLKPPGYCDDDNPCTADECVEPIGCVHSDKEGACDDGSVCTENDFCGLGGKCNSGPPIECDDGVECTDDACDPVDGCVHAISAGFCLIDSQCIPAGTRIGLDGDDACKVCDPAQDPTVWGNSEAGYLCSIQGTCVGLMFVGAKACGDGNGTCEDGEGQKDCAAIDTVCGGPGCDDDLGCLEIPLPNGTKCGGEACAGDTFHKKDFCASGICQDGGVVDCNGPDAQCQNGYCAGVGCSVQPFAASTNCTSGASNTCVDNAWHPQDYCDGGGSCTDSGFQKCTSDNSCLLAYCSGGCGLEPMPAGSVCDAPGCADACTAIEASLCDGENTCHPGNTSSCDGDFCAGSGCTSNCQGDNAACCDTDGDNRTCIANQCADRATCGATCDPNDLLDCQAGLACVDCKLQKCPEPDGWRCYQKFDEDDGWFCED